MEKNRAVEKKSKKGKNKLHENKDREIKKLKRKVGRPKGSKNKKTLKVVKKHYKTKKIKLKKQKVVSNVPTVLEIKRKRGRPRKIELKFDPEIQESIDRISDIGSVEKSHKTIGSFENEHEHEDVDVAIDEITEEAPEETQDAVFVRESPIEDILFKLPIVSDPFIGTPQQVQKDLDSVVKKIQKNPDTPESKYQFDRIHLYMHGYLINIVLKQFPYIRGMQTTDIYQQTLFALWTKAIPGFKKRKKMSFLNFAKMCIRRHLITELNNAAHVGKHQAINKSISLDSPVNGDDENSNTFSNTVADEKDPTDKITEKEEAFRITRTTLMDSLSEFERIVLNEYLSTSTYKEIARNISKITKKRCSIKEATKSVDNALLRIRKKAIYLKDHSKPDDIPLFIK